jgi:hypothetical protein
MSDPTKNIKPKADSSKENADDLKIPFLRRYPVIAGALLGLVLRILVFTGKPDSVWTVMTGAFIYLAPLAVGAVTVYVAERTKRRTWNYYVHAPFYATCWFVFGTLLLMVEGLICAIVIIPMFAVQGAIGGLIMGAICRFTNWPKPTVYCLASLPIVAVFAFGHIEPVPEFGIIERTRLIAAPAEIVWGEITNTSKIPNEEMRGALAMKIGVPAPIQGEIIEKQGERVRRSSWGKQVYFDEVITDWVPSRFIRWKYRFFEDSFPPHALDDHVVLGGHYFDLNETSYQLDAVGEATNLTTRTRYRISTHFNFYAQWAAQLLIGNLNDEGLALYAERSEKVWKEKISK